MSPILDRVKDNALSFYDDVQKNLTDKGKNVDELRVRVIAFRDVKRWRRRARVGPGGGGLGDQLPMDDQRGPAPAGDRGLDRLARPAADRCARPGPYTDKIPKDFSATLAHAVRDPIESELPLVKVPTLVTRGAREPIVPMAWAQAAARLLPRGKLAVVPGSPHNANYSAADHLAELVLTFLFPVP